METSNVISSIISIIAVIISVVALIRGRQNSEKLIELEEIHAQLSRKQLEEFERAEKERFKANIGVSLQTSGGTGMFLIENKGPATAKNIFFSLNEEGKYNPLVRGDFEAKIPFPLLYPEESYHFRAHFPLSVTQKLYGVDLRWETEDGTQHKQSFTVSR